MPKVVARDEAELCNWMKNAILLGRADDAAAYANDFLKHRGVGFETAESFMWLWSACTLTHRLLDARIAKRLADSIASEDFPAVRSEIIRQTALVMASSGRKAAEEAANILRGAIFASPPDNLLEEMANWISLGMVNLKTDVNTARGNLSYGLQCGSAAKVSKDDKHYKWYVVQAWYWHEITRAASAQGSPRLEYLAMNTPPDQIKVINRLIRLTSRPRLRQAYAKIVVRGSRLI